MLDGDGHRLDGHDEARPGEGTGGGHGLALRLFVVLRGNLRLYSVPENAPHKGRYRAPAVSLGPLAQGRHQVTLDSNP